jgi:hypothetical protein
MATDDDAPPDDALPDAAAPDETRAKDLDPAQLAELASWFDLPSRQVVEERQARAAEESYEEREWRETRERRDAAAAAADPALIAYVSRHETRPPPFKPLPPVKLTVSDHILMDLVRRELDRFEHEDPLASPERPYSIPNDIQEALSDGNAPQAILRDLYRPETTYELRFESPFDQLPDLDPVAEVRKALRTPLKVEWLRRPGDALDEARSDFRSFLLEDWSVMGPAAKAWRAAGDSEGNEGR